MKVPTDRPVKIFFFILRRLVNISSIEVLFLALIERMTNADCWRQLEHFFDYIVAWKCSIEPCGDVLSLTFFHERIFFWVQHLWVVRPNSMSGRTFVGARKHIFDKIELVNVTECYYKSTGAKRERRESICFSLNRRNSKSKIME